MSGSAEAREKLEQIVRACFLKAVEIILHARVVPFSADLRRGKVNRTFNIELDELDVVRRELGGWDPHRPLPLFIEVFLDLDSSSSGPGSTAGASSQRGDEPASDSPAQQRVRSAASGESVVLIERWQLLYLPTTQTLERHQQAALYKRCGVLLRALHARLRLMPAHRLSARLAKRASPRRAEPAEADGFSLASALDAECASPQASRALEGGASAAAAGQPSPLAASRASASAGLGSRSGSGSPGCGAQPQEQQPEAHAHDQPTVHVLFAVQLGEAEGGCAQPVPLAPAGRSEVPPASARFPAGCSPLELALPPADQVHGQLLVSARFCSDKERVLRQACTRSSLAAVAMHTQGTIIHDYLAPGHSAAHRELRGLPPPPSAVGPEFSRASQPPRGAALYTHGSAAASAPRCAAQRAPPSGGLQSGPGPHSAGAGARLGPSPGPQPPHSSRHELQIGTGTSPLLSSPLPCTGADAAAASSARQAPASSAAASAPAMPAHAATAMHVSSPPVAIPVAQAHAHDGGVRKAGSLPLSIGRAASDALERVSEQLPGPCAGAGAELPQSLSHAFPYHACAHTPPQAVAVHMGELREPGSGQHSSCALRGGAPVWAISASAPGRFRNRSGASSPPLFGTSPPLFGTSPPALTADASACLMHAPLASRLGAAAYGAGGMQGCASPQSSSPLELEGSGSSRLSSRHGSPCLDVLGSAALSSCHSGYALSAAAQASRLPRSLPRAVHGLPSSAATAGLRSLSSSMHGLGELDAHSLLFDGPDGSPPLGGGALRADGASLSRSVVALSRELDALRMSLNLGGAREHSEDELVTPSRTELSRRSSLDSGGVVMGSAARDWTRRGASSAADTFDETGLIFPFAPIQSEHQDE